MVLAEVRYHVGNTTLLQLQRPCAQKILELALKVERVAPLAGQKDVPAEQTAPAAAAIINNHFHAPASVAIGGDATQIVVDAPTPGDTDALLRYLVAARLRLELVAELEEQLKADESSHEASYGGQADLTGAHELAADQGVAGQGRDRHHHGRSWRRDHRAATAFLGS